MYVVLNEPEYGDLVGVQKVARAFRTPVKVIDAYAYGEVGSYKIPPADYYRSFADARKALAFYPWIGLEVSDISVPLQTFDFNQAGGFRYDKAVLITGSMNHGLPDEILCELDAVVEIEQAPGVEFLSPTVAVGIFLYERSVR